MDIGACLTAASGRAPNTERVGPPEGKSSPCFKTKVPGIEIWICFALQRHALEAFQAVGDVGQNEPYLGIDNPVIDHPAIRNRPIGIDRVDIVIRGTWTILRAQ